MSGYVDKNMCDASAFTVDFIADNKTYVRTVIFPLETKSENFDQQHHEVKKYLEEVFNYGIDVQQVEWICDLWCPLKYFTPNE